MKTTESEEAQEQFWTIFEFLNCALCMFLIIYCYCLINFLDHTAFSI